MIKLLTRIRQHFLLKNRSLIEYCNWIKKDSGQSPLQAEKAYILNDNMYWIYVKWRWCNPFQVYIIRGIDDTRVQVTTDFEYPLSMEKELMDYMDQNALYYITTAMKLFDKQKELYDHWTVPAKNDNHLAKALNLKQEEYD